MTDFLSIEIWILLSGLIQQVETGTNTELDEVGNETGAESTIGGLGTTEMGNPYDPIVQLIKVGIAAFSLLLLGLSISAYKKTALKSILYAAAAFGLFAIQLLFDFLEDVVKALEQPYNDVIFYAMTLGILVLFFLAIVKRR
jgi:hypothetical protein